jgi:hypothetical protein
MRTPIAIGMVVGLVAVAAVALHAVAADAGGCSAGLKLVVAAAPDIAPAVHAAAARWEQNSPKVSGQCIHVQVNPTLPADVANSLAVRAGTAINVAAKPLPTPAEADVPTVWVPDSSSWISRMQAISRDAFEANITSVATSPVVLAMPEAAARALPGAGVRKLTMADIGGLVGRLAQPGTTFKFGLVEPRRDAAGLAGATVLYELIATSQSQLPKLVGAYRQMSVSPDQASLIRSFGPTTMAAMSEQGVLAFDASAPSLSLAAVPADAFGLLDYPYATIAGKPLALTRAADMFRSVLLNQAYQEHFSRRGFRARDGSVGSGFPIGDGVSAEPVVGRPLTNGRLMTDVLNVWNVSANPSRIITLIDVTSSMNLPMTISTGQAVPRIALLRQVFGAGVGLFSTDSDAGAWYVAAGIGSNGKDYKEVVPVARLDEGQRAEMARAFGAAQPVATDVCPLYEAILAAYRELRDSYRPGAGNSVVVLTDSTNNKPGMEVERLLRELEKLADVTRPVKIVILGLGPDVNLAEITRVAAAAGGPAFQVRGPEEIAGIFARALLGV